MMSGITEWRLDNGRRTAVFHTLPGESVMYEDGKNSFLIEHDDGDVYVVTIGPLAHLTPVWRQWVRWEAER